MISASKKRHTRRPLILLGLLILFAGLGSAWYIFTETFSDTATVKSEYRFNANAFIREFRPSDAAANKKYSEKIITIDGKVTETELADTAVNLKMVDTATGSYLIFAFQQSDALSAKKIKKGDSISIKGSCSGGIFSDILETEFISFKRCSINKN